LTERWTVRASPGIAVVRHDAAGGAVITSTNLAIRIGAGTSRVRQRAAGFYGCTLQGHDSRH
jgi:hypothetical protein